MAMSLDDDDLALFIRLRTLLEMSRGETRTLNQFYEGDRAVAQLGLAIPPELVAFSVFLNWPRVAVDGLEQRLDVTGFRMPDGEADKWLWENWQYNDLDEGQTLAHTDALALARSYICVGTNPDDPGHPLVTVESPLEMITLRDPRTRRVLAALRLYSDELYSGQENAAAARGTLYLPNSTHWLSAENGWGDEADPDFHGLGVVPVVPLINRHRVTRKTNAFVEGVSEMADIIPIAESASRAITNAQLAQETHAVPQRGVLGASKGDFVGADGKPVDAWQTYFGAFLAMANKDAKTFQFDASDLSNFQTMVNLYARIASGVAGMPIEYFGLNTENAPSAEGQRAGESRLIKKAERRQVRFGHGWEAAARLQMRFRDGTWNDAARGLETMWRDAGTPTVSQVSAAVTAQFQAGLTDWETAQEDLGRTPGQIAKMKTRRAADLQLDIGAGVQQALVDSGAPGAA